MKSVFLFSILVLVLGESTRFLEKGAKNQRFHSNFARHLRSRDDSQVVLEVSDEVATSVDISADNLGAQNAEGTGDHKAHAKLDPFFVVLSAAKAAVAIVNIKTAIYRMRTEFIQEEGNEQLQDIKRAADALTERFGKLLESCEEDADSRLRDSIVEVAESVLWSASDSNVKEFAMKYVGGQKLTNEALSNPAAVRQAAVNQLQSEYDSLFNLLGLSSAEYRAKADSNGFEFKILDPGMVVSPKVNSVPLLLVPNFTPGKELSGAETETLISAAAAKLGMPKFMRGNSELEHEESEPEEDPFLPEISQDSVDQITDIQDAIMTTIEGVTAVFDLMRAKDAAEAAALAMRKNTGVASADLVSTETQLTHSTCSLIAKLHESLAIIGDAKFDGAPWEKLLLSTPLLTLASRQSFGASRLTELREALHSRICKGLSLLKKRIGGLFRSGGICNVAFSSMFVPAQASKQEVAANTLLTSNTRSGDDICDVILTTRDSVLALSNDMYELVKSSEYWPSGELNLRFEYDAIIGDNQNLLSRQPPFSSRVLMFKKCKNMPQLRSGAPPVRPVSDVKLVPRTFEGLTEEGDGPLSMPCAAERALLAQGYTKLELSVWTSGWSIGRPIVTCGPAWKLNPGGGGYSQQTLPTSCPPMPKRPTNAALNRQFTFGWWHGKDAKLANSYKHVELADLNGGRSNEKDPLFVYIQRNPLTPMVDMTILPLFDTHKLMKLTVPAPFDKSMRSFYNMAKKASEVAKGLSLMSWPQTRRPAGLAPIPTI